jgi:hypothetical protein
MAIPSVAFDQELRTLHVDDRILRDYPRHTFEFSNSANTSSTVTWVRIEPSERRVSRAQRIIDFFRAVWNIRHEDVQRVPPPPPPVQNLHQMQQQRIAEEVERRRRAVPIMANLGELPKTDWSNLV